MNEVIVHQVDVTHYRLLELSKLADQAKPFYDWVEKTAKRITSSHKELNEILMSANRNESPLLSMRVILKRKTNSRYYLMVLGEFIHMRKHAFTSLHG